MADAIKEAVKDIKFYLDRINELTERNKELEAALRVAAGYISTKEGHTDQHPQDVYDWIVSAALGEKKNG